MKKTFVVISALMLIGLAVMAQKVEVLYFKAELACCQARACDAVENDVKEVVEKNFKKGEVEYKQVKLTDENNKALVEKHKARSQTVIIVAKNKKNETVVDVSDIVRRYSRSRNKADFESELIAKINECVK